MNARQPNSQEHKIARDDSAVKLGYGTGVAFHSTPREGYKSKFLVLDSKGRQEIAKMS